MNEAPLAVLVTDHCQRTGDTLAAIAHRGGLSRQTVSGLVHGGRSFPRPATLRALARGLGIPYEAVREAAVRGVVGEPNGATPRRLVVALVAYAETLTDDQLEVVLATARALARV